MNTHSTADLHTGYHNWHGDFIGLEALTTGTSGGVSPFQTISDGAARLRP